MSTVEIDVGEHRVVHLAQHREEDLEHRGAGLGVLAAHDPQQRIALQGVGALVDDGQGLAVAHVDGPRVLEDARELQAIESTSP